jgi:hypothetical protein
MVIDDERGDTVALRDPEIKDVTIVRPVLNVGVVRYGKRRSGGLLGTD